MSRKHAIELARKSDGEKPPIEYIQAFCNQIQISMSEYQSVVDKHRNKDIWKLSETGEWVIRNWIDGNDLVDNYLHTKLSSDEKSHIIFSD